MPKEQSRDGLRKLGPGRWLARLVKRGPDGTKVLDTERVIKAPTKLEAAKERQRLLDELTSTGGDWTFSQCIDDWLPTLRPGTRHAWGSHARKVRAAFGPRRLRDVPGHELQRFLVSLPVSDRTANNVRAVVSRLYAHARSKGHYSGPAPETVPRHAPKTNAELLAEIAAAPRKALIGDELALCLQTLKTQAIDLYPLVVVELLLGCRFAESSALQWPDVDIGTPEQPGTGAVQILRGQYYGELGPPKGKRARVTGLGPFGVQVLLAHRARMFDLKWPGYETWVFPRPLYFPGRRRHDLWDYSTARLQLKRVLQSCGLQVAAVTHALRHSYITAARAEAQDDLLRRMVGHETARMTEVYTTPQHGPAIELATRVERTLVGKMVGDSETSREDH